ncbi:MAG: hypothetical protein V4692_07395 [Bdellovibrionota bacterium]
MLLLSVFAFVLGGVFFSDKGPVAVFENSGPRLGARLEQQLATGRTLKANGDLQSWAPPNTKPPTGQLQ